MSDNSNNDDGGGEGDNDTTTTTTTTTLNDETQQPRKKRIVKKKEIVGIQLEKEYIKEELRKFKVDQLKELLDKRKIFHTQSIQKEAIINLILEKQQQKARYQEFIMGTVNYALPVYLIIKIFRLVWDELLDKSLSIDTSLQVPPIYSMKKRYRMALYLASVNKQLFNVVSLFSYVSMSLTSGQLTHIATAAWCVVKRPDKLEMGHRAIDNVFFSDTLDHSVIDSVSRVTKIKITYGNGGGIIRKRSFEQMSATMCSLVSFVATSIKLEVKHFEVLARIPTLVKVDFIDMYNTEFKNAITSPMFSCYIACFSITNNHYQQPQQQQQQQQVATTELPTNPPPLPPLPPASKFKYLKEQWNCTFECKKVWFINDP
ncbi:hypothetical protein DFA_06903 [Cavenderia fasciculata]|uniref:Uncharacterized protein n=1 Tax=Cavenderia fasciculata TaxID=261658 RepID=F4PWZ8_CACFS|nr:uncharacterized protein DFA_06903 [Cavenderia fasciculata]EGG19801.1 hypothetical protein DFA_06903 [Cavenderia fasciculata]|eukprot:XP_004358147.1 hypothetical protein DFA_06903 [Cavenderia fasciculata]